MSTFSGVYEDCLEPGGGSRDLEEREEQADDQVSVGGYAPDFEHPSCVPLQAI
jgi:hypothetical protein